MEPRDHNRVNDIICACFRWLADRENWNEKQIATLLAERTSETLEREITKQDFLVASIDRNVVGLVSWYRNELAKLYVDPAHHRRGIGTQLFQAAEQALRNAGYREMRLHAPPTSVSFYQAMSMTTQARCPWRSEIFRGHTLLVMTKRLANASCGVKPLEAKPQPAELAVQEGA